MVEIVCWDGDKTACVNKDLSLGILLFLKEPKYQQEAESMLVQGSSGWLLRSYVVEKLHLNKVKTGYVDKGLKIDILLFFEGCQVPTYSRI